MKLFKTTLRIWIAMTSLSGFMAGWILLAHSPKPQSSQQTAQSEVMPLPTLIPIVPFDPNRRPQSVQSFAPVTSFLPSFRTGGS